MITTLDDGREADQDECNFATDLEFGGYSQARDVFQ